MLDVSGLTAGYGHGPVVQDVALQVDPVVAEGDHARDREHDDPRTAGQQRLAQRPGAGSGERGDHQHGPPTTARGRGAEALRADEI